MKKEENILEKKNLKGSVAIIKDSFAIFFDFKNLKYLVSISLVNFLIVLPLGLALAFIAFGRLGPVAGEADINFDRILSALPLFIFTILVLFIVSAWTNVASILAVANVVGRKKLEFIKTYKESFFKIPKYLAVSIHNSQFPIPYS